MARHPSSPTPTPPTQSHSFVPSSHSSYTSFLPQDQIHHDTTMLKSTIVNVFCALLLAQASSGAVIQGRTCRLLHTDSDTGATATVDCDDKPTSSFTPPVPTTSTSTSTSTSCTTTSSSTPSESASCHQCTDSTVAPLSSSTVAHDSAPTTTATGGVAPPHPPRPTVEPAPAPSGPYQGKFFQIIPKGQENLCLSVFSGDAHLSGSDGVNV